MANREVIFIMDALEATVSNFREWGKDYTYDPNLNEFSFKGFRSVEERKVAEWFNPAGWCSADPNSQHL
jgi:hypothetical protein